MDLLHLRPTPPVSCTLHAHYRRQRSQLREPYRWRWSYPAIRWRAACSVAFLGQAFFRNMTRIMSFSGAGLKLRFSLARRRDSSGKLHTNRYICVAGVEQVLLQFIVPTVRERTDSVLRSSTGPEKGLSH
jgi:hypothetical protein